MVKYSLFILIALVFFLIVSCISGATEDTTSAANEKLAKELFDGITSFVNDLTDISTSSNVFVKIMRDMADGIIKDYDEDKKEIQGAVKKGTEMVKKIQSVLKTLKNSSIPLTKELQEEIDAIGKHATSELKKLKGMENVKDIEGIETVARAKHADIKEKFQELFKLAKTFDQKASETTVQLNYTEEQFKADLHELKQKLFAIVYSFVPTAIATERNVDTISKKMETTYTTLFKIRSDLKRVEKIQYNSLRSCKAHSGTDASFLTRSLLTPFVFTIFIGIVF